ncbi:MAG: NTP transferase domain-containing protein [Armatimonadetes bacterium]|nr:NTP transferase domain-containing protein [Armatimonadota bacterium]
MKGVILAAGQGKRMRPLTDHAPKPLLKLKGHPLLEYILAGMREAGADDFLMVVNYLAERIEEHFGGGSRWGVRIAYVRQDDRPGTGGAVLYAEDFVGKQPFMKSFGDILTDFSHYRLLAETFAQDPCDALLGLNWQADPSAGSAIYREGSRIVRIIEKPPPGTSTSHWNNAGVSIYRPSLFQGVRNTGLSARGEYEITQAYQTMIDMGLDVRGLELHGFWSDAGTPAILEGLEKECPLVL